MGKLHQNKPFVGFLIVLYVTLLAYSFKYAMDYPYICSTDYRLFAQLILPETVLLCLCAAYTLHDDSRKLPQQTNVQKKISVNFLTIFIGIYALLSVFIYIYEL